MPQFTDWQALLGLMLLIAFLTETIVEVVKTQLIKPAFGLPLSDEAIQLIATLLGIILAWLFGAKLFETDNLGLIIVGYIVVGIVSSRGSNFVHNWLDKLPRK